MVATLDVAPLLMVATQVVDLPLMVVTLAVDPLPMVATQVDSCLI